ncbi:MAG: thiamine pyrophosphate-dependent enzyme, partial [Rhodobacteraceae bacterium]|nr:thiamine pyrophosphate-dependent enzyme [Paracoccaceae bacterium]
MATASKTTPARSKSASRTRSSAKKAKPAIAEFDKDEELHAYREMLLIRRFEEKAGQLYGMGLIGGFCHLYIGQEAVVVGMQMAK